MFKNGDNTYVVEAVPGAGRSSYQFRCIESGWCVDVEPQDVVILSKGAAVAVHWISCKNGHLAKTKEPTPAEKALLLPLGELEGVSFSTLEEALLLFSRREILDTWLRYAGIQGYTDSILTALETLGYDLQIEDADYLAAICD